MPMRNVKLGMPRRFLLALRHRIIREHGSIAAGARAAGIPRERLTRTLGGRADLTGHQWRRLWVSLGLWDGLWVSLTELVEG